MHRSFVVLLVSFVVPGCTLLFSDDDADNSTEQDNQRPVAPSQNNNDQVATITPLAHWDFDNIAGNTVASVIGDTPGLVVHIDQESKAQGDGLFGKAFVADGENRVEVSGGKSLQVPTWSYAVWGKIDSALDERSYIITEGDNAGILLDVETPVGGERQLRVETYFYYPAGDDYPENWSSCTFRAGVNLNDGRWHHFVGTFNDATKTLSLYVDGQRRCKKTFEFPESNFQYSNGEGFVFGAAHWGSSNFKGAIDDVQIYDRELSDNEVMKLYEPGMNQSN